MRSATGILNTYHHTMAPYTPGFPWRKYAHIELYIKH